MAEIKTEQWAQVYAQKLGIECDSLFDAGNAPADLTDEQLDTLTQGGAAALLIVKKCC
jgi:hypothetical protein